MYSVLILVLSNLSVNLPVKYFESRFYIDTTLNFSYATEDVDIAQHNLDLAQSQLANVMDEYNNIMEGVAQISNKMEDTTNKAFEAQAQMLQSQQYLKEMAKYEYKNSLSYSLTHYVLEAKSFEELIKNLDYANSYMKYQYSALKDHESKKNEFENCLAQLSEESQIYNKTLQFANEKINQAYSLVNDASLQLDTATANQLIQQTIQEEQEIIPESIHGGGQEPIVPPETDPEPPPDPPTPASWNEGVASAYGGSSDPYTPNPGRTATGDICDDWSMGVAVPMAWSNYRSYFRHAVQIRYGSQVVLATINDCGYMGGGSRSLDLQPGVFKAFGFETCQAWGLRDVEYVIL